jgi:hypothetical protein
MVMMIPVEVCFRENGFVRFVKVRVWDMVVIVDGRVMDSFRGDVDIGLYDSVVEVLSDATSVVTNVEIFVIVTSTGNYTNIKLPVIPNNPKLNPTPTI